jgi:HPt (histidine-containing phosphotransfer) domain-containing protein
MVEHAPGAPIPIVIVPREAVPPVTGWPVIPSIDSDVLHQLFGDDSSLFLSLLGRVLREYAAFEVPCSGSLDDGHSRKALQLRAHKLKGSAGVIGATSLRQLAGAVEGALIEGRPSEVVERALKQLASALATLRAESLPYLKSGPAEENSVSAATSADFDQGAEAMDELRGFLDHHNLAAVDAFDALVPRLGALLSSERLGRLRNAIDDLDFPLGAQLLREARLQEAMSVAGG